MSEVAEPDTVIDPRQCLFEQQKVGDCIWYVANFNRAKGPAHVGDVIRVMVSLNGGGMRTDHRVTTTLPDSRVENGLFARGNYTLSVDGIYTFTGCGSSITVEVLP